MELKLNLTEMQLRGLNSNELKYYLGTEDEALTKVDLKERINDILDHIKELSDSANQLNHLECEGVEENWSGYSKYSMKSYNVWGWNDA